MNRFENDEHVHSDEDGKTNVHRLGFKTVLDGDVQTDAATATCLRRVGNHHGSNKHQQPERNLSTSVREKMCIHGHASWLLGDECTL